MTHLPIAGNADERGAALMAPCGRSYRRLSHDDRHCIRSHGYFPKVMATVHHSIPPLLRGALRAGRDLLWRGLSERGLSEHGLLG